MSALPGSATHIAHGYTLSDIEQAATIAAAKTRHLTMAPAERHELSVQTVALALCQSDERPHFHLLVHLAVRACQDALRADLPQRGTRYDGSPMPMFHRYWDPQLTSPWEDRIVDRMALVQIWPNLPPQYREVLAALAAHGQFEPAAASIGVSNGTFRVQLLRARRAFAALWHDGETPRRHWRSGRPAQRGRAVGGRPKREAA